MRKAVVVPTVLSALLTAAPLAALAQSSVTLYGAVDDAIGYTSNQKGKSNVYLKSGSLESSKFGFKGSEDLGGGTQAFFRLESGFNVNNGAMSDVGYIFSRLAYVGVGNDRYGSLTLGRQYTPYLLYVGALGSAPVLTGATGAHPGDIDQLDVDSRASNAVTYTSPNIAGLQVSTLYALGGVAGDFPSGNTFSAALKYDYKQLALAVGYLKVTNNDTPGRFSTSATGTFDQSPINAGYVSAHSVQYLAAAANYTFGPLLLGLNYANVQYKPDSGSLFRDTAIFNNFGAIATYQINPAITFAGGYSYTRASSANGVSDPARFHQFSFEQTYSLSKRSTIYFLEAYQHALGQTLGAAGAGHIVDSVAMVGRTSESTPSSGSSQFVGMVGFRHRF
ncbi:porin [Paraburkholderia nemoris]|uniref:porin n=1 Tax=Paraburkholderia nemoris TaxID=2793076 RepID=UPI0038B97CD7